MMLMIVMMIIVMMIVMIVSFYFFIIVFLNKQLHYSFNMLLHRYVAELKKPGLPESVNAVVICDMIEGIPHCINDVVGIYISFHCV